MWEVYVTDEVDVWLTELSKEDWASYEQVVTAISLLEEGGPALGRPLVDRVEGSSLHNLKELRPGSAGNTELRLLFMFDPWRSAIVLVGGNKAGNWTGWYRSNIPKAEKLYAEYLGRRKDAEA